MIFEDESSDDQSSIPYMHSTTSFTDGLNQVGTVNALLKFWSMYEDIKSCKVSSLESALMIHHLTEQRKTLEGNYDKLAQDVHELMKFEEDGNGELKKSGEKLTHEKLELELQVADMLKGKEKLCEERVQLKLIVVELMKGEEKLKQKIKGI
ncbi:hypothetical protein D1007_07259 [Hordeum vulgare]|nr:hypothetical protein D1007_07259 [Hordeum vulgare]